MELLLLDTPFGPMALAEEEGAICRLYLPGAPVPRLRCRETPLLAEGRRWLAAYFAGDPREPDLPLAPAGTPFQREVWAALRDIPRGKTCSYGQLAAAIGRPAACRAVGMACRANPIPLLIPCHRVLGAKGALTGYAGGLELKQALLQLEQGH